MNHGEVPNHISSAQGEGTLARMDHAAIQTKASDLLAALPPDLSARATELAGTRRAFNTIGEVAQKDQQKAANIVAEMNPRDFRAFVQVGERASSENSGELLGKVPPATFAEKLDRQSERKVEQHLKSVEPDYAQAVRDMVQARMEETQARMEVVRQARQMEKADPASAARRIMASPHPIEQAARVLSEMKPKQAANILAEIPRAEQALRTAAHIEEQIERANAEYASQAAGQREQATAMKGPSWEQVTKTIELMEQEAAQQFWGTATTIAMHMDLNVFAKIVEAEPEKLALVNRALHSLTQREEGSSIRAAEAHTAPEARSSDSIKVLQTLAQENPKQAVRMLEGLQDQAPEVLGAIKSHEAAAIINAGPLEKLVPTLVEVAERNPPAVAAILQDLASKKGAEVARLIDIDTLHPVLESMQATEQGSFKVAELVAEMAKIEEWKAQTLWGKMKIVWMDNKVKATLIGASTALSSSIDVSQIAVSDHGIANMPFLASALTASITSLVVGRYGYEQMQKRTIPRDVPHFGGKKLTDSTSLFQISFSVAWGITSGTLQFLFNYFLLGHS